MISIQIVCTHDVRTAIAEPLARVLKAEDNYVRLSYGRQAGGELEAAQNGPVAVLLIWSETAPSSTYMREWAQGIDPERLVEIATAPVAAPAINRKAPVIDFSRWRGERGGQAWNALAQRLRTVMNIIEPPPPQTRQAGLVALGGAGAMAFSVVSIIGAAAPPQQTLPLAPTFDVSDVEVLDLPMGGPLDAVEPISADDLETIRPLPVHRFTPLEPTPALDLYLAGDPDVAELRDPTLLERLAALNPLD